MSTRFKILLVCALAFILLILAIPAGFLIFRSMSRSGSSASRQLMDQLQSEVSRAERQQQRRSRDLQPEYVEPHYAPISNLYSLGNRGCSDHEISSLILQNELIKKDRRLAYQQLDIDRCNALIFAYVKRGVTENSNYLLRRKLVESLGQTNRAVLINRLRLVSVLLGGEKSRGGMDPRFTPIREEAHRFSPYVTVMVSDYIRKLEEKMKREGISPEVPEDFKEYVDSLGTAFDSERGVANTGARYRDDIAKELYAMNVLLRDLREYYGERMGEGEAAFNVVFTDPGSFRSETLQRLSQRHADMSSEELCNGFIEVGLELREHLSELRDQRGSHSRVDDEEVNHLKRLNEIVATVTGLFAAERLKLDPLAQAKLLVDVLYLEGLYSKKERKALKKELGSIDRLTQDKTKAFYALLNFMSGLAFSTMDESLGEAARAFSKFTSEADNYLEIQARKSSLQVLGQLQVEFHDANRAHLSGEKDIHLSGVATGLVKVFRSHNDIANYLSNDPRNGENTIWILKSGLTMPNEASFAAIIMEDPIMKASHYDGYARSRQPPIPLLQIPGASESFVHLDSKYGKLEANRSPHENVSLTEIDPAEAVAQRVKSGNPQRIRLSTPEEQVNSPEFVRPIEIDSPQSNEELRNLQKNAGSKAANYAFLRTVLPLEPENHVEHIYPGFAIQFGHYRRHIIDCGARVNITRIYRHQANDAQQIRDRLLEIQSQILSAPVDRWLLEKIRSQLDNQLQPHHTNKDGQVKLRFRSSSNAEDNKEFSGAGLYESHSAFYTFPVIRSTGANVYTNNEEEISRAIKRVWASLWKPEAFFAREQAGIVQESVAMGILVHPSYRKEESTGVIFHYGADDIEIVINDGNENVQNPSIAGLVPEFHHIHNGAHSIVPSSCFPLSGKRILSESDHAQMMELIGIALPRFQQLYPEHEISGIDVEFKILELPENPDSPDEGTKDVVMLKQIRPLAKRQ